MKFLEQIKHWANERNLYAQPFDAMAQIGFLQEEAREFTQAKDDNGRIDALCDLIVFAVNAIYTLDADYEIDVGAPSLRYQLDEPLLALSCINEHISEIAFAFSRPSLVKTA